MSPLHYSHFFDIHNYAHKCLFKSHHEDQKHVWDVLANIHSYILTQKQVSNNSTISPLAYLVNPELIFLGNGCVIEPGAYIEGPCILGDHCQVRHAAYIRGNFIAGNDCVIGHCTEVKNAIFLDNVHADHFAYIGDSILGNAAHLGAGVKLANLRLDNAPIVIHHAGIKYATGRRKLGAIIGDGAQLGCNSVTNPGSFIGKNTRLLSCTPFGGGVTPPHADIRREGKIVITTRK